jgi:hypothetical protein
MDMPFRKRRVRAWHPGFPRFPQLVEGRGVAWFAASCPAKPDIGDHAITTGLQPWLLRCASQTTPPAPEKCC